MATEYLSGAIVATFIVARDSVTKSKQVAPTSMIQCVNCSPKLAYDLLLMPVPKIGMSLLQELEMRASGDKSVEVIPDMSRVKHPSFYMNMMKRLNNGLRGIK
jgi:hypothetical protein